MAFKSLSRYLLVPGLRQESKRMTAQQRTPQDLLDEAHRQATAEPVVVRIEAGRSYRANRKEFIDAFEREYVAWLIKVHGGNISAAARAANMDRKHLYDLAKKHQISRPTPKAR